MSALTIGIFERPQYGMGRSFALSAAVHIALAVVLFLGVRWQVHAPDTVTVDLVDAPPPPPPAAVEPPKPEPKPIPKVEPEPVKQLPKPDIALQEKKKPKPKAEPKPKPDPNFEKRLREQVAAEQKAFAQQLEQQRQERELRELIARQQADAARAAAAARAKALNEYIARIQAKVKSNWILPADMQGNPQAVFRVVQLPTGEVLSTRLVKSSGNAAYDTAVERAILKSSPLPLPASRELFHRELELTFRPHDK